MIYGSVCSGIEAASVAWAPLGWRAAFAAEIDPFARAVLKVRWPEIPLHGDFTTIRSGDYRPVDVLVGGTPCQSFSIAGLRGGLDDDRGNLAREYLRLADRLRPRWLVWENVAGVLSSHRGRDFGALLGGLGQLGYGFAYRVLDAQFFGVPQQRRRVFVVGRAGDWRPAAAVLFERASLSGNPPPRREARPAVAAHPDGLAPGRSLAFGGNNTAGAIDVATARNAHGGPHGRLDFESETFVAFALRGRLDGSVPELSGDVVNTIRAAGGGSSRDYLAGGLGVRRLTPRECERLQGFPDDYTLIPWRKGMAPDGPRYRTVGDSMAVPVMRWIGERIAAVDALTLAEAA